MQLEVREHPWEEAPTNSLRLMSTHIPPWANRGCLPHTKVGWDFTSGELVLFLAGAQPLPESVRGLTRCEGIIPSAHPRLVRRPPWACTVRPSMWS